MRFASDRIAAPGALTYRLSIAIALCACSLGAQAQNKCSASGRLGGEKFTANHCAVALYGSQHSVAIWFNENPISAQEAKDFESSATVEASTNDKQRTFLLAMFCPGGGGATASANAVKSISLSTNHAKSPVAGIRWTVRSPRDFKVQKMDGAIKPGGSLVGAVTGSWRKTTFDLEFDVKLPARESESGMDCGK